MVVFSFHRLRNQDASIAKCTAQQAGHNGNVLTVRSYQHCARQLNAIATQWHTPSFDDLCPQWFARRQSRVSSPEMDPQLLPGPSPQPGPSQSKVEQPQKQRGCPKGAINRRHRRGAYRFK